MRMVYICECEDYPCCGHSAEDRYTTYTQAMKEQEIGHKTLNHTDEEYIEIEGSDLTFQIIKRMTLKKV